MLIIIVHKKKARGRAIDALYRISTLSGKHQNAVRALEAILDEVMTVFSANSVSISLLNASSDTLLIEVQRGLPEKAGDLSCLLGWVSLVGWPLRANRFFVRMTIGKIFST